MNKYCVFLIVCSHFLLYGCIYNTSAIAPLVKFDSIPFKINSQQLNNLKGWTILNRYENALLIIHDTGLINKFIYDKKSMKFKYAGFGTYYMLTDSSQYKRFIDKVEIENLYHNVATFENLDVDNIESNNGILYFKKSNDVIFYNEDSINTPQFLKEETNKATKICDKWFKI